MFKCNLTKKIVYLSLIHNNFIITYYTLDLKWEMTMRVKQYLYNEKYLSIVYTIAKVLKLSQVKYHI